MYEYFNGKIVSIDGSDLVIDVNGIGYRVEVPSSMQNVVRVGEDRIIYVEQVVSENKIAVYGFVSSEEKRLFNLLKTVSKVGPKSALGILSSMSIDEIIGSIRSDNKDLLVKAPGIGDKSATRIIIELRDKLKDFRVQNIELKSSAREELIGVLEGLGYTRYEIIKHIQDIDLDNVPIDSAIKLALKGMSQV